ncbi:hypothetical protein BESB_014430 [Besnoitia besnoiti]|uniref:Uncharacterized protein n=1 Tax=Besnoitia besnoiti TaxID=94643 RepID=A0A2A9MBQ7_BESBE|nr:hypothetical protein BESB_014430 [Besnoitia besnoiti]PFH32830.1 hypothetical protein BESB_014430 [Besnoitia besnoiti]
MAVGTSHNIMAYTTRKDPCRGAPGEAGKAHPCTGGRVSMETSSLVEGKDGGRKPSSRFSVAALTVLLLTLSCSNPLHYGEALEVSESGLRRHTLGAPADSRTRGRASAGRASPVSSHTPPLETASSSGFRAAVGLHSGEMSAAAIADSTHAREQDVKPVAVTQRGVESRARRGSEGVHQLAAEGPPTLSQPAPASQKISFVNTGFVKTRKKKHQGQDLTEDDMRYAPTTAEEYRAGWRREEQVNEVPFCKDLGFGGFHPEEGAENYCWSRCGRACEGWMFLSQDSKAMWTLAADAKRVKPCLTPANKSHRNILCKAIPKPTSADYVEAIRHEMDIVAPDQVPPVAVAMPGAEANVVMPAYFPGMMWGGADGLVSSALSSLPLALASLAVSVAMAFY